MASSLLQIYIMKHVSFKTLSLLLLTWTAGHVAQLVMFGRLSTLNPILNIMLLSSMRYLAYDLYYL